MIRVKVLVSYPVFVEYEDKELPEDNPDGFISFDIEENHCPGTGKVGAAVIKLMEEHQNNPYCKYCPEGTNKILEIIKDPKQ